MTAAAAAYASAICDVQVRSYAGRTALSHLHRHTYNFVASAFN